MSPVDLWAVFCQLDFTDTTLGGDGVRWRWGANDPGFPFRVFA